MPILPPPRRPTEAAPAPAPENEQVQEPVAQPAPEPSETPKKATPKKVAASKKAPVKTPPPKKAAKAKDDTNGVQEKGRKVPPSKGPKPAVEIKIPRVAALKTKLCNDDQHFIWELIHVMRMGKIAVVKGRNGTRIEIRCLDDRAKAFVATHIKIAPKGSYVQEAEVKAIGAFIKQYVPKDMAGKKWGKLLFPED